MKTEMTEFTATENGELRATWYIKLTLTPEEEAAYWKAKYERVYRDHFSLLRVLPWITVIAVIEFIIIAYLLVR